MNERNYIDPDKLSGLMREVWEVAVSHGWHDKPISREQYLGLIVTEASEAVEADRNGRRAKTDMMANVIRMQAGSETGLCQGWYESWFKIYYDEYVRGSIEEEFADVVIRLLDMAQGVHGEKMSKACSESIVSQVRAALDDKVLDEEIEKVFDENDWNCLEDMDTKLFARHFMEWQKKRMMDGLAKITACGPVPGVGIGDPTYVFSMPLARAEELGIKRGNKFIINKIEENGKD
ncbi:MAG: hypothetical protein IJQ79_03090 [Bacteroidales bacterium]|nr:hypothetical protein [Bacteroidales bacterium]